MLMTKKLKYDPPNITILGKKLALVKKIKLLGLIIDDKLNFKSHMNSKCKQVVEIYKQLA